MASYLDENRPPYLREIVIPALASVSLAKIQAFIDRALEKMFE